MFATYADYWRPQQKNASWLYELTLVLVGSLFIALTAQFSVQIGPVPITGQTLGVLLIGMLFGRNRATLTLLTYLAEGAIGLPVFAAGKFGLPYMLGPTGGYLLGFVLAAAVVGYLAQQGWDRQYHLTILAMIIGNLIIYACGLPWLRSVLAMTWEKAWLVGAQPFLIGDLLKILVATILLPTGWRLLKNPQI